MQRLTVISSGVSVMPFVPEKSNKRIGQRKNMELFRRR